MIKISDKKERERAFEHNYKELSVASHRFNQERQPLDSLAAKAGKAILAPLDGEVWPWPISEPGVELKGSYITNPEADSIFRTLVFFKYGMTFRELIVKAETDREAHRKLLRIHRDWYRIRWENVSLGGLKLKFNLAHCGIIMQGLDFGLDKLNEWDLAECLDEICPCSQKHSAEYLKKLRIRMVRAARDLGAREL